MGNHMRLILIAILCTLALNAQQKKILVAVGGPDFTTELQTIAPNAKIVRATSENVMQEITDADAYIGDITSAQVRAGKNLKWVGVMSAGVETVLFPKDGTSDLRDSNIILTNNKIVQGPEIADHALAMLLMLYLIGTAGAARASVVTYFNPVVATLLGVLLLGEPFGWGTAAAMALVLLGSWLATRGSIGPGSVSARRRAAT